MGYSRNAILDSLESLRVRLPGLEKLQWRVDVSISTRSVQLCWCQSWPRAMVAFG